MSIFNRPSRKDLERELSRTEHQLAELEKQYQKAHGLIAELQNMTETKAPVRSKRSEILAEAAELIDGDRARTYGDPLVSFTRIADIYNAMGYRHHTQIPGEPLGTTRANKLTAVDAALLLLGMKVSRTVGARDHQDNWVDLAGYSGLGGELAERLRDEN